MLYVNMMYLACKGQKYTTTLLAPNYYALMINNAINFLLSTTYNAHVLLQSSS